MTEVISYKAKLQEYCQQQKYPLPMYSTEAVLPASIPPLFVSTVKIVLKPSTAADITTLGTNSDVAATIIFESAPVGSKKKAQEAVAKIALKSIVLPSRSQLENEGNDAFKGIKKAIRTAISTACPGLFNGTGMVGMGNTSQCVPLECLMLYNPVQHALTRVHESFKRDPVAGFKYLLSFVQAHDVVLPDNIKVIKQGERWYIYDRTHYRDSISRNWEWQQGLNKRTMANAYKQAMNRTELRFVVIPASSTISATTFPSSTSISSNHTPVAASSTNNKSDIPSQHQINSLSSDSPHPSPLPPSPYEVVLSLETPLLGSIDSDELEGAKLWNAFQAITSYWYDRTGSVGAFSAPIYQPPHELTTTLWPPRLMITTPMDSGCDEMVDNSSGNDSNHDQKKQRFGPRQGSKQDPFNPIASWLLAAPVYGDAILTIMDPDGFGQTTLSTLASCILASFPSDKWCDRGSRNLLTMPHYYFEPAWTGDLAPATIEKMKVPITILTEIISRRTSNKSYIKTLIKHIPSSISSSSSSIHTHPPLEGHTSIKHILVPEQTPTGWWKNGIYSSSKEMINMPKSTLVKHLDDSTIENDIITTSSVHVTNDNKSSNYSNIANTDTIESDRYFLSITLPKSMGLFDASGKEFVSATSMVGTNTTGSEAQAIEQALALRALWAIEEAGKAVLRETCVCDLLGMGDNGEGSNDTVINSPPEYAINTTTDATGATVVHTMSPSDMAEYYHFTATSFIHCACGMHTDKDQDCNNNNNNNNNNSKRCHCSKHHHHLPLTVHDEIKAFGGIHMLPPSVEQRLQTLKIGEEISFPFHEDVKQGGGLWLFPNCNVTLGAMMDGGGETNRGGDEHIHSAHHTGAANDDFLLSSSSSSLSTPPSPCALHILLTLKLLNKQTDITHSAFRRLIRPNLFYPTLSIQRRNLVTAILRSCRARSWLDLGCGDGLALQSVLEANERMSKDFGEQTKNGLTRNEMTANAEIRSDKEKSQLEYTWAPSLQHVGGLELTSENVESATRTLEKVCTTRPRFPLHTVSLWQGSVLDPILLASLGSHLFPSDSHIGNSSGEGSSGGGSAEGGGGGGSGGGESPCASGHGRTSCSPWDVISCIEVIEHLPSEDDAAFVLHHTLHDLAPKVAIFSTPNYEANRAIRAAVLGIGAGKGVGIVSSVLTKKEGNVSSTSSPIPCASISSPVPLRVEPFRETDHKFEWTREQFRAWAETGIASAGGGYEVSYVELGTLLPGMGHTMDMNEEISDEKTILDGSGNRKREEGMEWSENERGCGGATQVAIFLRKDVDIRHFHHHHDNEQRETKKETTTESPMDIDLSLKGLGVGGDNNAINDSHLNESHIPQSQSEPISAAQSHLYWQWCVSTGNYSSTQRNDSQRKLQLQSQLGHTTTTTSMVKQQTCREEID